MKIKLIKNINEFLFLGGIGATRYCSSRDLGNYCDYVRNRGDQMEYRSCIFTCDSDGCNGGSGNKISTLLIMLTTIIGALVKFF